MRVLLDSQVLLWSIYNPGRLPPRVESLLRRLDCTFFVSDASLWEVSIKISKGRLEYVSEPETFYRDIASLKITQMPISFLHIQRSALLPQIHGDPFDRMLVAQAQVEGLTLVSVDADIQHYDVPVIW